MKRLRPLIPFVLLLAAWCAAERLLDPGVVPPAGVNDVDSFLKWRPDTGDFLLLPDGNHLMVVGPWAAQLSSGPSAYVFDRSGRMVDWSRDIGDNPGFDQKWQAQRSLATAQSIRRLAIPSWISPSIGPVQ